MMHTGHSTQEPRAKCDTCHQYRPMSEIEDFRIRGEWFTTCRECEEKRLAKIEARRVAETWTSEELVTIANQSGMSVSRG